MSTASLREQVRHELAMAEQASAPVLTIRSESDIQALAKLIREMGSNPLLKDQLAQGLGQLRLQVMHGSYDGCLCESHTQSSPKAGAGPAAAPAMAPAFGGVITLARLQAAKIPKESTILLDVDAVMTPQVRDWLRQNKVQVQRSEA